MWASIQPMELTSRISPWPTMSSKNQEAPAAKPRIARSMAVTLGLNTKGNWNQSLKGLHLSSRGMD